MFRLDREFYLDIEYDTDRNLKTYHLPELDQDWLDPDGSAVYDKIGRQLLRFWTPSHLATVKLCPLCRSHRLAPPSPVRTNIDEDSQRKYVESEALG